MLPADNFAAIEEKLASISVGSLPLKDDHLPLGVIVLPLLVVVHLFEGIYKLPLNNALFSEISILSPLLLRLSENQHCFAISPSNQVEKSHQNIEEKHRSLFLSLP